MRYILLISYKWYWFLLKWYHIKFALMKYHSTSGFMYPINWLTVKYGYLSTCQHWRLWFHHCHSECHTSRLGFQDTILDSSAPRSLPCQTLIHSNSTVPCSLLHKTKFCENSISPIQIAHHKTCAQRFPQLDLGSTERTICGRHLEFCGSTHHRACHVWNSQYSLLLK